MLSSPDAKIKNNPLQHTYKWNDRLYYESGLAFGNHRVNNLFRLICFILAVAYVIIILLGLLAAKNKDLEEFTTLFFLISLGFALGITYLVIDSGILSLRNLDINSMTGKQIRTVCDKLFDSYQSTALIEDIPNELKDLGFKNAFVGKSPVFKYEHVRLDINPLSYIICVYSSDNPKDVNDMMIYRKIIDGVWHGEYSELIESTINLNWFCYFYLIAVWIIFAAFSYRVYTKVFFKVNRV